MIGERKAPHNLFLFTIVNEAIFKIVPVSANVAISSIVKDGGTDQTTINGIGIPFKTVTVEGTASITQPFAMVATVPVGGDGTFHFTDSAGTDRHFYRVRYP